MKELVRNLKLIIQRLKNKEFSRKIKEMVCLEISKKTKIKRKFLFITEFFRKFSPKRNEKLRKNLDSR
jgi:hypothetical protein